MKIGFNDFMNVAWWGFAIVFTWFGTAFGFTYGKERGEPKLWQTMLGYAIGLFIGVAVCYLAVYFING